MADKLITRKLTNYYLTAVISLVFSVVAFSYNTWRLEVSESNNTIRIASFEVLLQLSEFEQNIFAAHYDKDEIKGNPRTGWVKVGLISDLSGIISSEVDMLSQRLILQWQQSWENIEKDEKEVIKLTLLTDEIRVAIKRQLKNLE